MTGRACTKNPFDRSNWSVTLDVADRIAARRRILSAATFSPEIGEAPPVTDEDRALIDAAVQAGRVRRVGFDGKEIA